MAHVKTAISLDESLFREAEEWAEKLGVSRSQLFARAVEEYVRRHENEELVRRLAAVRKRIDSACIAAGREPGSVEMLAVTKTVPAEDVATLLDLARADGDGGRNDTVTITPLQSNRVLTTAPRLSLALRGK